MAGPRLFGGLFIKIFMGPKEKFLPHLNLLGGLQTVTPKLFSQPYRRPNLKKLDCAVKPLNCRTVISR